jgi:hypothetical protein
MACCQILVQIHQEMKVQEEFEALQEQRDSRKGKEPNERSACLVAVCPADHAQVPILTVFIIAIDRDSMLLSLFASPNPNLGIGFRCARCAPSVCRIMQPA